MVQKQVLATFPCRVRRRTRISMPAMAGARVLNVSRREHRYGPPPGMCSTTPAYGVLLAR